jgi:hypothetical protein
MSPSGREPDGQIHGGRKTDDMCRFFDHATASIAGIAAAPSIDKQPLCFAVWGATTWAYSPPWASCRS